jgi:putative copper export protein
MKKVLSVAQSLELLALSVWVGGLIVIIAAVIPAVFNTASMEVGGRIMTRTFQGYDRLVMISVIVMVLGMLARVTVSRNVRPAASWREQVSLTELILFTIMIVIAAYLMFAWNPQMARLQERAFSAPDPMVRHMAYEDFFLGHYIARALYMINLGLAITTLCLRVRRWAA